MVVIVNGLIFLPSALAGDKVGVIAGFSGDYSAYGGAFRRGIELADVTDVSIVFEDDQFIPTKTITAFNRLVEIYKVSAVVVGDSTTGQAVAPLAMKRGIPLLVWANAGEIFKGNPMVLRLWTSPEKDFEAVEKMLKNSNIAVSERLAVFTGTHGYAEAWGARVASSSPGGLWERFSVEPTDFRAHLLKIKNSNFTGVAICFNPGINGIFIRQLRGLSISLPIFGSNFLESTADADAAGRFLDGVRFTGPIVNSTFFAKFRDKTGGTDHLYSAAIFHDAIKLIQQALRDRADRPLINKILKSAPSQTALKGLKVVSSQHDNFLDFEMGQFVYQGRNFKLENTPVTH